MSPGKASVSVNENAVNSVIENAGEKKLSFK